MANLGDKSSVAASFYVSEICKSQLSKLFFYYRERYDFIGGMLQKLTTNNRSWR